MNRADRISKLPPYLFAEIDRKKAEAKARGVDLIHLGVGDPDQPAPHAVVEALQVAAADPAQGHYPESIGSLQFRKAAADWYQRMFQVHLDPHKEMTALIGSKEGIVQVCLAYLNPGDKALVPDPAYPAYYSGVVLAGGEPCSMPLRAERGFVPDLDAVDSETAKKAKIMFLNYPNNPTAGIADASFFQKVIEFARAYDIIVCHDFAYGTMTFDGYKPPSFLAMSGAKEVGIEFNSMSKPFNMTGWRMGLAAGCPEVIQAMAAVKSNVDSGQFNAIQTAAVAALNLPMSHYENMNRMYQGRRDFLIDGFNRLGWQLEKTKATFYLWIPAPTGYTGASFAEKLLDQAGIIVTPGNGYGEYGEGFFRIALTVPEERLQQALERIEKII